MINWKNAKTLNELCELNAQFLEGRIMGITQSAIDAETEEIAPILAEINRQGLFTTFSQPGAKMDEGCGQRAAVTGYATESVARRLYCLTLETDLIVLIFPPLLNIGCQIAVTTDDFYPFTWVGTSGGVDEISLYQEELSQDGLRVLCSTWEVAIVDPVWGREGYLWSLVAGALKGEPTPFHSQPTPSHGLDTDFVC